jgi:hypothetical protein
MSDQVNAAGLRFKPQWPLKERQHRLPQALKGSTARLGLWYRSAAVCALLLFAGAAWAEAPVQGQDAIDAAQPPLARCRALATFSYKLTQTAQSGTGHASSFRIDAAHYREVLRDLVKDNETLPDKDRLPRTLVLDMVRMAALLQSAAQCQTGRYIVCPPDLMQRLQRQQILVEQGLAPRPGER